MPNYNNTVIYMIYKPNSDLKTYVGHTTNFKVRLRLHRSRYNRKGSMHCDTPLYNYMRENGQFDEWTFEIITEYPCNSKREAEKKEQYFIDLFKSELNSMSAYTSSEDSIIRKEKYRKVYYNNHKEELLSKMKIYRDTHKEEINKKKRERIKCEICGFFSARSDISSHKKSIKCQSFIK